MFSLGWKLNVFLHISLKIYIIIFKCIQTYGILTKIASYAAAALPGETYSKKGKSYTH